MTGFKIPKRTILPGLKDYMAAKTAKLAKEESQDLNAKTTAVDISARPGAEKPGAKNDGIILDEYQDAALNGLLKQKYANLIGAAGTGKTTVTKRFVRMIENTVDLIDINETEKNVAIAFCAFTGRAVQQMKRALPLEYHNLCHTMHATLGYYPNHEEVFDDDGNFVKEKLVFRPQFTADNKWPYDVIVIDEGGMMPINLWNECIAACVDHVRIYIIGDINQLPPVQGRSVLGFSMCTWPTFTLEKIHRQAAGNPIIANAHRILRGQFPQKADNFLLLSTDEGSLGTFTYIMGVVKALHKQKFFDPFKDALIVPKNVGALGQTVLNEKLVMYFNPNAERKMIISGRFTYHYAVGDKIMVLQNDNERGLTNGMIGKVTSINFNPHYTGARVSNEMPTDETMSFDMNNLVKHVSEIKISEEEIEEGKKQADHTMMVEFDTGHGVKEFLFNTSGQFGKLTHAYATTCHKSQGGEYDTVIIVCHSADMRMLCREWLYTAVTRARKRVILIHNHRGLAQAINIQRIKGKTVEEKARQFLALQGTDINEPTLPEAEEI